MNKKKKHMNMSSDRSTNRKMAVKHLEQKNVYRCKSMLHQNPNQMLFTWGHLETSLLATAIRCYSGMTQQSSPMLIRWNYSYSCLRLTPKLPVFITFHMLGRGTQAGETIKGLIAGTYQSTASAVPFLTLTTHNSFLCKLLLFLNSYLCN